MTKHTFDADVAQLIKLVTHSIYSNKEIFLRELLSNANDALQKAKLLAAQDTSYLGDDTDLRITIETNPDDKTITITDNGIGMNHDDIQQNLGTIAKSGTKAFLEKLATQNKDGAQHATDLIGQFGIGFYSVFMVADKVIVNSKTATDQAVQWTSDGSGEYEIDASDRTDRGTQITIFLQDDNKDFADTQRLRHLIKTHSNYVPVPIMMQTLDDKGEVTADYEQINAQQALWTKNKSDVTDTEYKELYQELSFDWQGEPFDTLHIAIEGAVTYKAILFIPKTVNQFAMMQPDQDYGPKLYVQNVMIMDNCKELLPVWLRFVKGVVETNDLSLNVSREILQHSPILAKIQKSLVKEVIKSLAWKKKKDTDSYHEFHTNYGRILKEGLHYEPDRKDDLAPLTMFHSLLQDSLITLDQYIDSLPDDHKAIIATDKKDDDTDKKETWDAWSTNDAQQGQIYYFSWTSLAELKGSPYLSRFRTKKIDVLLMTDPIDEYVMNSISDYKGYGFKIATAHDVSLDKDKDQKQEEKTLSTDEKNFIAFVQNKVGTEKIEKVEFRDNIGEAAAMLVSKDGQASAQMQKIMQAMGNNMPAQAKILLLNSDHDIVKKATDAYTSDPTSDRASAYSQYLYQQARLLESGEVDDVNEFVKTINSLLDG